MVRRSRSRSDYKSVQSLAEDHVWNFAFNPGQNSAVDPIGSGICFEFCRGSCSELCRGSRIEIHQMIGFGIEPNTVESQHSQSKIQPPESRIRFRDAWNHSVVIITNPMDAWHHSWSILKPRTEQRSLWSSETGPIKRSTTRIRNSVLGRVKSTRIDPIQSRWCLTPFLMNSEA